MEILKRGHVEIRFDAYLHDTKPELSEYLGSPVFSSLLENLPPCIVVLGGDGALLRAISET